MRGVWGTVPSPKEHCLLLVVVVGPQQGLALEGAGAGAVPWAATCLLFSVLRAARQQGRWRSARVDEAPSAGA